VAAFGKEIFESVFTGGVAGLLGGAATVVLDVFVVLIGLTLSSYPSP
jgi:hypothetical protein